MDCSMDTFSQTASQQPDFLSESPTGGRQRFHYRRHFLYAQAPTKTVHASTKEP
jgi:hypothetical protein